MSHLRAIWGALAVLCTVTTMASIPASAQRWQKPNILFIMGDDIGWMQPSIYHRGLMVGETPNIDRIGNEGCDAVCEAAWQRCATQPMASGLPTWRVSLSCRTCIARNPVGGTMARRPARGSPKGW